MKPTLEDKNLRVEGECNMDYECPVVRVKLLKHPNADSLSIVRVFGWQCVVRTADWKDGDLGVYIPPDSIVPDSLEFAFLGGHFRVRARKLRGVYSMGLLIPVPPEVTVKEGDNAMEVLGVTHYQPPLQCSTGGENCRGPSGYFPVYDVENYRRYPGVLQEGEIIQITEKIHGANGRFVHQEGTMYCGSRTNWKKEDPKNLWWKCLQKNKWLEEWCQENPGFCVYGEVYGQVQDLKYGAEESDVFFAAFDLWGGAQWQDLWGTLGKGLQKVPVLFRGPLGVADLCPLAEGVSAVPGADNMREGVVVRPVVERTDVEIGRVQLKIVSSQYLSRKEKKR